MATPSYRAAEKQVADAEAALQSRYGKGVSATYTCSVCSRFSHDHADHDVKDCTMSPISSDKYKDRLADQLADLQNVLSEHDKVSQLGEALDEQKEAGDLRLVKLGALMQKIKRIQKRLKNALEERSTAAADDREFFDAVVQLHVQLDNLGISNVMSPSPTAVDSESEDEVPPPRAPYIYTPMPSPRPSTPPPRTTGSGLTSPPRLKEQPGVTIIHATSGDICGGSPDGNKIVKVMKSVDCGGFSASQGGINFLQAKNKLFTFLSICCAMDTMYTQVGILYRLAPTLKHHLDELTSKTSYFTSFEMFFKHFELLVYPDLDAIVQMKVAKFAQGSRTVRTYYSDMAYLLKEINQDEDRFVLQFIDNLSNEEIKKAMRARPVSIANDSMKAIAEHASRMEALSTNSKQNVSSVNKHKKRESAKMSIATTTVNDYWQRQRNEATEKARENSIKSCVMCAGNHKFSSFETCGTETCYFCHRRVKAKGGHFSILCSQAPSDRSKLKAAFEQA